MKFSKNTAQRQAPARPATARNSSSLNGYMDEIGKAFSGLLRPFSKPFDRMYWVAVARMYEGNLEDAASRFRVLLKFRPNMVDAWFQLGNCEMVMGNNEEAAKAFYRVLSLKPDHEDARFLYCVAAPHAVAPASQPKYIPLHLVVDHFNDEADYYDEMQLYETGYRGHEMLFTSVQPLLNPAYKNLKIVDLGCGTGLVGLQFADVAERIEGVDISENMLILCQDRRTEKATLIYDAVHHVDLRRYLMDCEEKSADLLLAAHVMPYLGGLTPVFDGVARTLRPGGLFAFSTEIASEGDFQLVPGEGRYCHSEHYLREQAQRVGLDVVEFKRIPLYRDYEGYQMILRQPSAAPAGQPTP